MEDLPDGGYLQVSVLFVTGAGVSANAGIPTYRDGGSSWKDADLEKKSHATRYGNHLDELWDKHWGPVSEAMRKAEPTAAHRAITAFQDKHDAIVATQNIDDLHERAGNDNVIHLHGSMDAVCMKCKGKTVEWWAGSGAPKCLDCESHKTRPDVVLFGEMLSAQMMNGLTHFAASPETTHIVAVGTSLNVFPAAGLVMDNISKAIIVNKEPTTFDKWAKSVYHADCDSVIDEVLEQVDSEI